MNDINQVFLVGRLTRDSETKYTANGQAICKFSLAVNRSVKKDDRWTDEASFFDLSLWGKMAESLGKFLVKGKQVAVSGELRQNRWEKDGQKMSKVEISVNNLQLLGGAGESRGGFSGTAPAADDSSMPSFEPSSGPANHGFDDDEIPF